MEFYSDYNDVYLRGQLQKYVVSASELTGEVLMMQQDYRALCANPEVEAFIPDDGPTNYGGYATVLCRGNVLVYDKVKVRSGAVRWLPQEDGLPPTAEVLTGLLLTVVAPGLYVPYFHSADLDDMPLEGATHYYITECDVGLNNSLDLIFRIGENVAATRLFAVTVQNPSLIYYKNALYNNDLTFHANMTHGGLDLRIGRTDHLVDSAEEVALMLQAVVHA